MANDVDSQRSAGCIRFTAIVAFAAYAALSLSYAQDSLWVAPLYAQTLLYLAVSIALWRRAAWAPWFAIGIALSGLAIDLMFVGVYVVGPAFLLDTAAQGLLLMLARRTKDAAIAPSPAQLTAGSHARIGWTFALSAGVLPPAIMAALAPMPASSCLAHDSAALGDKVWWTLVPLAAIAGMQLMARLRTAGVLVMVATCAASAAAFVLGAAPSWDAAEVWYLRPEHVLTFVAQAFLVATLVPLGPTLARALFPRR
jgi:hypothetical protein